MARLRERAFAVLGAALAALALASTPALAEKRVALVVGNGAYAEAGRLVNAPNDAREIASALKRLDFDVTRADDVDNAAFGQAVQDFVTKAQGADVALFFYAGHALQLGNTNYLLPVDARLANELSVKRETISAQDVVEMMEGAAKITIVFLDACRNNPLSERLKRSLAAAGRAAVVGRGLGRLEAKGRDTLIVFSAEPGEEALDTTGGTNSPFAAGLLAHMETPGLEIEVMLKDVTKAVRDATDGKQQPERLSRLESKFYFKAGAAAPGPSASDAEMARLKAKIEELEKKHQQAMLAPAPAPGIGQDIKPEPPAPAPLPPASDASDMQPGTVFRDCPECPEMVVVSAGSFTMGSPDNESDRSADEGPQRKVTIAKPLAVGKFEVTVAEYQACVEAKACKEPEWREAGSSYNIKTGGDDHYKKLGAALTGVKHPIVGVSWDNARAYLKWLSIKTGKSYRLLTEAEWEYAARAGTTTPFSTGKTITTDQANFDGNYTYGGSSKGKYREKTIDVGSFQPNAFGLYDMHGNVWEWVEDCYKDSYQGAPTDGSASTSGDCSLRVLRGGSWDGIPGYLRAAIRIRFQPGFRLRNIGFRLART